MASIDREIRRFIGSVVSTEIVSLEMDVFGFSRGAAAARNFIWECLNSTIVGRPIEKMLMMIPNVSSVGKIEFVFAGLYDTVASFGVLHFNDTNELHLTAVGKAKRVVQLAAAEEYRENFRLTNIKSASGTGVEIFLPGVHSDLGGSYKEDEPDGETGLHKSFVREDCAREMDWFVNSGWFDHNNEIWIDISYVRTKTSTIPFYHLKGNRQKLSQKYSHIPLHIMAEYATDPRWGLKFVGLKAKFPIQGDVLVAVDHGVRAYIKKTVGPIPGSTGVGKSKPSDWFDHPHDNFKRTNQYVDEANLKKLRRTFLHLTSNCNYLPNAPQFEGRVRKRRIQNG